jgi:hypothetical protein
VFSEPPELSQAIRMPTLRRRILQLRLKNQQLASARGPLHQVSCTGLQKVFSKWRARESLFFHHFRAIGGIFLQAAMHPMRA